MHRLWHFPELIWLQRKADVLKEAMGSGGQCQGECVNRRTFGSDPAMPGYVIGQQNVGAGNRNSHGPKRVRGHLTS